MPSALLAERPDIVAAEHRLRAADANIGAARAAFFPRITLTAALGSASSELDGLFQAGSGAWTLTPRLALPLVDGGRNRAALELADTRRELAVAQYEKSVQGAFREVADALAARKWLLAQLHSGQAALATQSERARLAKLRYDSGAAMLAAPTTHFVELSQAILYRGAGLEVVWRPFMALAAIGAALFALALSRFRKTISLMA